MLVHLAGPRLARPRPSPRRRAPLALVALLPLAALALLLVAAPPPATSAAGPMTGLHVAGNRLLNGANQQVHLHGVNRSSLEYGCLSGYWADGPLGSQSEVDAMKQWNINSVRVVLNEDCWLGLHGVAPSYSGSNYQNYVANYVNLLTTNGLSVIINLHFNGDSTSLATEQEPMADRAHSNDFWTSVANTFKTNSAVLFEPYNEPHDLTWACWRDGGCTVQGSQPGESAFVAAGMQEMVNAIRATGATNVIVVTGLNWGSDLSQWPQYRPTDPINQLVAGWHSYGDGLSCQSLTCWNSTLANVLNYAPILATEIGEFDCNHTYVDQVMSWLDGHNLQGYYAWTWGAFDCARDPALLTDWSGGATQTYGTGYKAHLLQLGSSTPTPTSAATPTPLLATPTPTRTPQPPTATTTPPRTPTPTGTATPQPATPTGTATPNTCTTSMNIGVQAVANGDGRLRVTVTDNIVGRQLVSLSFGAATNAVVDAPPPAQPELNAAVPPASVSLPSGTLAYTFYVGRATAGRPTHLPLTVADTCGTWPTFVGGGVGAF